MSAMDFSDFPDLEGRLYRCQLRSMGQVRTICNFLHFGDAIFSNFGLQLLVLLFYNKHVKESAFLQAASSRSTEYLSASYRSPIQLL